MRAGARTSPAPARSVDRNSDRDDRIFARLFALGQVAAAALFAVTVAAGRAPFPTPASEGPRTIELHFDRAQLPPEPAPQEAPLVTRTVPEEVVPKAAEIPKEPEPTTKPDVAPATPDELPPEDESAPPPKPPRRVYGVRRVLANGLGGEGAAGGLVTKVGNGLRGVADSLVATPEDLAGTVASISAVDAAPEPVRRIVPEYTEELRRERASGTVTARLLIDPEGAVRQVVILSDFGLGSADLARSAFEQFRFRPARRDGEAVSVWIVHKIRFEFQE